MRQENYIRILQSIKFELQVDNDRNKIISIIDATINLYNKENKMRAVSIIELFAFLKYMNQLTIKRIFWAYKTRLWCNKFHNKWWQNSMLHGAGRYVYTGYHCQVCGAVHYEFKLNKT